MPRAGSQLIKELSPAMCRTAGSPGVPVKTHPSTPRTTAGESGLGPQRTGVSDKPPWARPPEVESSSCLAGEGRRQQHPQARPMLGYCGDPGVRSPSGGQRLTETWDAHILLKGARPSGLCHLGPRSL